ncbi:hypothetical protein EUTSA_v10022965mg [Eutrema salsugineum]|uniref:Uncharacterized protein n=1 Tax=Eutrema salsugineum TaxID=72664 RepID=V4NVU2_EUTSA|nr:hypothetical protein EUTSA_v10022965mg [Eutrema salsugineum]
MKFSFVVFLAVTSVISIVTVPNVEAKHLLPIEAPQLVLDDEANSPQAVKPQVFICDPKCHVICTSRCFCIC